MKVWDGETHQSNYLKKVIEKELAGVTRGNGKISLGIMEIDSELGYNLKDYYKTLMRKLREYATKLSGVTYITLKRK